MIFFDRWRVAYLRLVGGRCCRKPRNAYCSRPSYVRMARLLASGMAGPFAFGALNYELGRHGAHLGKRMRQRCLPMFTRCTYETCSATESQLARDALNAYRLGCEWTVSR